MNGSSPGREERGGGRPAEGSGLPGGLDFLTSEDVEDRRLELEMEPESRAWEKIERAIDSVDGTVPGHAALAAEIRLALKVIPERDVRAPMARAAEKLARERKGVELRASEILRALDAQERESQKNDRTPKAGGETWNSAAPQPTSEELLVSAGPVLDEGDQLGQVRRTVQQLGYAGDTSAVELLHLAFISMYLDRPINVQVEGPSAGGKTFTVEMAMRFHPPEAIHDLTAMSERALAYTDFETRHRFVVISEASALFRDGTGATIIRELAWGNGIRYELVDKTRDGLRARVIEKPGPTGLVTTTTRPLDPEISTRLLRVQITDSPRQTRGVVESLAQAAVGGAAREVDFSPWHAAQRWLELYGCRKVVVPFAEGLAAEVPVDDVRMRRDFQQVLTVLRAHAFLHQRTRETDVDGRIMADRRDYEAAYRLLKGVLAITLDSVSQEIRETVAAVGELTMGQESEGVSCPVLAEKLGLSRSGASRRAKAARAAGYLANAEERKGYPAKLITADPLPEDRPILPAPDELFAAFGADTLSKMAQQLNTPQKKPVVVRKTGVERGVESPQVLTQHPPPTQHPTQHLKSHGDAENSGGVEPLRGNQGGPRKLARGTVRRRTGSAVAAVCPSCGGGMEAGREFCSTCTYLGARSEKGSNRYTEATPLL